MMNEKKAKQVKSCDYHWKIALKVLEMLNPKTVRVDVVGRTSEYAKVITDSEPMDLIYPEGWYYAKSSFRNKHQSTSGFYYEIRMVRSDGSPHQETYCTL